MNNIVKYLYEIGQLKKVRRTGWWIVGITNPESVAEHSFRTAMIGLILAHLERVDVTTVMAMCLVHDMPETRINDLHWIAQRYINMGQASNVVFNEQASQLPTDLNNWFLSLFSQFELQSTPEAIIAGDADKLELVLQAREYETQGHKYVEDWINNMKTAVITNSAKQLLEEILNTEPREWWAKLNTPPTWS